MMGAETNYNSNEWTECPPNCWLCTDPNYGHPRPHPDQDRIVVFKNLEELTKTPKINIEGGQ
jgi:hypothetical protein